MKILGFEIRKFEKHASEIKIIETWCVKWSSLHRDIIDCGVQKTNVLGFPTKDGAEEYAKELRDARNLLGDKGWNVVVYKQETYSNK